MKRNGPTLTVFDIDHTLLYTEASVWVSRKGKRHRKICGTTFHTHKLRKDEAFDFGEYQDSAHFQATSRPIQPVLAKAKRLLGQQHRHPDNKFILLTARGSFDNHERFLDTFRGVGFPIHEVEVVFSGDLNILPPHYAKTLCLHRLLNEKPYRQVRMFDDVHNNLDAFLGMRPEHPNTLFTAFHVTSTGTIHAYPAA